MQYNIHPVLAPQLGRSQTISTDKVLDHHLYTAVTVSRYREYLFIEINALPKEKLVIIVVCYISFPKSAENKTLELPLHTKISQHNKKKSHPEDFMNNLHSSTVLYESDYSSGEDNIDATINDDFEKIETLNMRIKIRNI